MNLWRECGKIKEKKKMNSTSNRYKRSNRCYDHDINKKTVRHFELFKK